MKKKIVLNKRPIFYWVVAHFEKNEFDSFLRRMKEIERNWVYFKQREGKDYYVPFIINISFQQNLNLQLLTVLGKGNKEDCVEYNS